MWNANPSRWWSDSRPARTFVSPGRMLVAGNDESLAQLLSLQFPQQDLDIDFVDLGSQCLEKVLREPFAIVILDSALSDMGGFEVLSRIRARLSTPVVLLTADGRSLERIVGLEIGADDCLEKPFDIRELAARVKAILRRSYALPKNGPLVIDGVTLDASKRIVTCHGTPIDLTASEFDVLETLLSSAGKVVTREDLSRRALGREPSPLDRSIDNHISRVRNKLGASGSRIRTIRGVGYIYSF